MKSSFFEKGTYWYMVPTIAQFSETYSEEEHKKCAEDAINAVRRNFSDMEKYKNTLFSLWKGRHMLFGVGIDENGTFSNNYICPLILFLDKDKLIVETPKKEEMADDVVPLAGISAFLIPKAVPIEKISPEVKEKIGVKPKQCFYLGTMELGRDIDDIQIENLFIRDFVSADDREDYEDVLDDCWSTHVIDVLVCTEWEGQFDVEDEYSEMVPIPLNFLDDYRDDNLLKQLSGKLNNYYVWAELLYFAGILNFQTQ